MFVGQLTYFLLLLLAWLFFTYFQMVYGKVAFILGLHRFYYIEFGNIFSHSVACIFLLFMIEITYLT